MRLILILLTLMFSFASFSQESSLDCLSRRQKEEIYKIVKINELLETRKSECDTIILTLERQNRALEKKSQIGDTIIVIQKRNLARKDEIILNKDEQLKNLQVIIEYKDKKIRIQAEELVKLHTAYEKEKPKKWRWGGMGLLVGAGTVLLFLL